MFKELAEKKVDDIVELTNDTNFDDLIYISKVLLLGKDLIITKVK